jgi:hypothetical protein
MLRVCSIIYRSGDTPYSLELSQQWDVHRPIPLVLVPDGHHLLYVSGNLSPTQCCAAALDIRLNADFLLSLVEQIHDIHSMQPLPVSFAMRRQESSIIGVADLWQALIHSPIKRSEIAPCLTLPLRSIALLT